jgi:hypothetical protein
MSVLRLIIPGRPEQLIQAPAQSLLYRCGLDERWMVYWVLYNWMHIRRGPDSARYEMISDVFECLMESATDDDKVDMLVEELERDLDLLTLNAHNLYQYLQPSIGDLCLGSDQLDVSDFEFQPHGTSDTVITLELDTK